MGADPADQGRTLWGRRAQRSNPRRWFLHQRQGGRPKARGTPCHARSGHLPCPQPHPPGRARAARARVLAGGGESARQQPAAYTCTTDTDPAAIWIGSPRVQIDMFCAAPSAAAHTGACARNGGSARVRRIDGLLRSVIGALVQGTRRRENPFFRCGRGLLGLVRGKRCSSSRTFRPITPRPARARATRSTKPRCASSWRRCPPG
jgi:hypothetical protein